MTYSIAFHSYKGGTGKTTLASNLSAFLAKKGYKVCLLDLDLYAPSLQTYFEINPKKWLNECLYYNVTFDDVLTDLSYLVSEKKGEGQSSLSSFKGKLYVGLSDFNKDDFIKLEGSNSDFRKQSFHRLIVFREHLIKNYNFDYIILDTSPGVRYWSLNALALSDIIFLTLKMGDVDIDGTKKMVSEIYNSFTTFGSKSFLILNKVSGYCIPNTFLKGNVENNYLNQNQDLNNNDGISKDILLPYNSEEGTPHHGRQLTEGDQKKISINIKDGFSDDVGMKVISYIPCYCDIQFSKKEFLTATQLVHPFSERIDLLTKSMQQELKDNEIN
jgi:chromosome partitioning protein